MTANEKKKIMDWIEENQFKVSSHPPMADYILNADDLTAFIESLSTEEEQDETYKESDYLH
jgi:hypothetical protein